jgi:hypothetical protein
MTNTDATANEPLPLVVAVTKSFQSRIPSQRVLDLMRKVANGASLGEIGEEQPSQMTAFRVLLRDFPERDPTSLWMHAYDVEVEVTDLLDPTSGTFTTPARSSADTGG